MLYKSTLMQVLCDYGLADGIYKETYKPLFGKGGKVLHDPDYQTVDQVLEVIRKARVWRCSPTPVCTRAWSWSPSWHCGAGLTVLR